MGLISSAVSRRSVLAAAALIAAASPAWAQLSSTAPLRLVTQYAPGGGSDLLGHTLANELRTRLGRSVVVEPRPGASGAIANSYVANATPDGTVLLFAGSGALTVNPHLLNPGAPVDPLRDFRPVAMVAKADLLLLVTGSLPVNSVQELIALDKSKPDSLNFASSGTGTAPHLAGALLNYMAGLHMVHVPYKGSGPTYTDLVAGRTQVLFSGLGISKPFLHSLKIIATGGTARSPELPNVPTIAESGVPGFEATVWYGILAPKAVPDAIVDGLNKSIREALAAPNVKQVLADANYSLAETSMTPDEFGKRISGDYAAWAKTLPQLGVKME